MRPRARRSPSLSDAPGAATRSRGAASGFDRPVRVYLDTCILSRLKDVELGAVPTEPRLHADSLVLPSLVTRCRQRGVALCTSEESLAEIDRLAPHRPDIRDRLRLAVAAVEVLPVPSDRAVSHALVAAVESFLLAKTRVRNPRKRAALRRDALHLAAAVDGSCDVFLTTDYASIWAYRRGLQRLLDLRVMRPVELAALV